MSSNKKFILIGLDGATWDVLIPLTEKGKLPAIKKLIEKGVWGELKSTIPPVTGAAWVSLATGKNPGKTGVFDFLNRKDNSYKLHPTTSADLKGSNFWDYIASNSNKVGLANYPMLLFPPYRINGFMVSNIAFSSSADIAYPKSLRRELNEVCGGYENFVPYHDEKYDDVSLFLEDLNRVLDKQIKATLYLLKQEWGLFVYVISATDWIQHLMWKYIDTNHSLYEQKTSDKYKEEFIKFWQKVDGFLREIIKTNKEANIFIVSDHGFGPQEGCFNLAKWLEQKDYLLRIKGSTNSIYIGLKRILMPFLLSMGKTRLRGLVPDKFTRKVRSGVVVDITNEIDFSRSKAYVMGHTLPFGAIYINKTGRDPKGNVNEEEYEALKLKIKRELKNLKEDIGEDVDVYIYDSSEIYKGRKTELAPDIIFTIDNWKCVINDGQLDGALFKNGPYSSRHTGSHRMNGIFIAYGPDIQDSGEKLNGLKIYDIAPTILHMFGIAIPMDIDGRVLKEIFKENSEIAMRAIKYQGLERDKIKKKSMELKKLKKI